MYSSFFSLHSLAIKDCQQVGPTLVRQKIHQACISIIRGVKAQEASVSTEAIPTKINCLPLYLVFTPSSLLLLYRWQCKNVVLSVVVVIISLIIVAMPSNNYNSVLLTYSYVIYTLL